MGPTPLAPFVDGSAARSRFAVRVRLLVLRGLGVCLALVGSLAAVLLIGFRLTGRYTEAVAVMAAAAVLVAGAYFLGFLLANLGRYGWLCASFGLGLVIDVLARMAIPGTDGQVQAYLIAAATVLVLHLAGLLRVLGDARHHR